MSTKSKGFSDAEKAAKAAEKPGMASSSARLPQKVSARLRLTGKPRSAARAYTA